MEHPFCEFLFVDSISCFYEISDDDRKKKKQHCLLAKIFSIGYPMSSPFENLHFKVNAGVSKYCKNLDGPLANVACAQFVSESKHCSNSDGLLAAVAYDKIINEEKR